MADSEPCPCRRLYPRHPDAVAAVLGGSCRRGDWHTTPYQVHHIAGAVELHCGESPRPGRHIRVSSGSPNLPLCEPRAAGHRADHPLGRPAHQSRPRWLTTRRRPAAGRQGTPPRRCPFGSIAGRQDLAGGRAGGPNGASTSPQDPLALAGCSGQPAPADGPPGRPTRSTGGGLPRSAAGRWILPWRPLRAHATLVLAVLGI
jgi:hypothetical protein